MDNRDFVLKEMHSGSESLQELGTMLTNGYETFFYGCGNQGFICEDILVNSLGFSVQGYIVSEGQPLEIKWDTELQVCYVTELLHKRRKVNIVLTMGYSTACSVKEMLIQAGFENICLVGNWEATNSELRELALKKALNQMGCHLSKQDNFAIGDFRFINPYEDELVHAMFMRECENIIGERYLNEKTKLRIDSSYEWNDVKLEAGNIVLDCGANIGLFSALAASLGCTVFSFEPVKHIAQIVQKAAMLYPGKISVIEKALSDEVGKVSFMQIDKSDYLSADSSAIVDKLEGSSVIEIPSITVDEIVRQYKLERVDFIKADIEGAERKMLAGAKQTLRKFGPKLSICTYHLPDDKEVLTKIILEANPEYIIENKWDKLYAYIPN